MIVETSFGKFEIIKNHREAFNQEQFEARYVDVAFDRYTYLVGDLSSELLRLKGFSQDLNNQKGVKAIPDYLNESCNINCPYYILKRVK